ncbi:hypothetical protein, partial [Streptomyces hebeiensis]|uniref:hypothetical protein n=1 Tax=Streptomyces hebeiensis TaxID=229486 RepID=UPI0031E301C1
MKPGSVDDSDDLDVCRQVAFRAAQRDCGATAEVLVVVEELLKDEAEYEFAVTLLENLQNLVSHDLDMFRSPDEMCGLLGPRSAICWDTVTGFWAEVATWRVGTGAPLESATTLLGVQNESLRMLLWTANRTLPTGSTPGGSTKSRIDRSCGGRSQGTST